ncbi:MAG: carbonic anhydrase family protein [Herminiimonas sp.]|nr:carbonic anhydrase family protein [Herminiimonas sp.]
MSRYPFTQFIPAFLIAAVACAVAPMAAHGSDDPHAAPAKPIPAAAVPAAPIATPKVGKESPPAPESKAAAQSKTAAQPEAKDAPRDAKSGPTATPQEVAARIAERLAALRTAKSEKNLREATAHRPAPKKRMVEKADGAADGKEAHEDMHKDMHKETHWSYGGEGGPVRWGEMNPEWAKCSTGNRQSPIDIRSGIKVDLEQIAFDYKPSGFSIIDNGHTIQVNLGAGNHITVGNRMYELVQFHFHRPSEEKIDGRSYDMVAHLVHKDASGKLAVVAVLIERGAARKLVQTVWNNLPLEKNETVTPAGALDMNGILPTRREYYTYMGSLTTPPCSEGVLWMVMKEPVAVSQDQLDIFARLYQMNARPIQLSSERLVKESN